MYLLLQFSFYKLNMDSCARIVKPNTLTQVRFQIGNPTIVFKVTLLSFLKTFASKINFQIFEDLFVIRMENIFF